MTEFVDNDMMIELGEMIDELCDETEGLTRREIGFIDNLINEWEGYYTVAQAKWLKEIHGRLI